MTETPARPKTLDGLKDAFLKNAIRSDERGCDLRETVLVHEPDPATETAALSADKIKPAESRA